ncbi:MAG: nucleotidyltransferase [Planctomycetes bacterium]|nr:nucleotidyltransferase [Planctomycetota bacterium]
MNTELNRLLAMVVEHLDVPKSYYEKAAARHKSLGEWLHRPASLVRGFAPDIRPQGSFRYGTVIRPLNEKDDFDLDNVCLLRALTKGDITQVELKRLYGEEIKGYAKANGMLAPVEEHNRCWRLQYADEVGFHLDTLPCVPEDPDVVRRLVGAGVQSDWANRAIAITDRKHPQYHTPSRLWTSSNPRGFAHFFESRVALGRSSSLLEGRAQASIEDVPSYEWKTTLQRSIQILKRHRDVMFRNDRDLAPISMVITNLAARAYSGESDLLAAITNIVTRMGTFVRQQKPRVPNPADPFEDYADKWSRDPRLEKNFWTWHEAVTADIARLPEILRGNTVGLEVRKIFRVDLTLDELREFTPRSPSAPAVARTAPSLIIPSAPKPWGNDG